MATATQRTRSSNGHTGANGKRSSSRGASAQPRMGQTAPELQRFGTLRQLPIALSAEARRESCQILNEILSDSMVLAALYKKAHWNAAGPTFFQLHLLFDKHYEEQLEIVDALAERVQMLGGISVGDPRHAAELTTIPRPPDGAEEVPVAQYLELAVAVSRDHAGS
jgi:starvation-inducible DNA-binding protein